MSTVSATRSVATPQDSPSLISAPRFAGKKGWAKCTLTEPDPHDPQVARRKRGGAKEAVDWKDHQALKSADARADRERTAARFARTLEEHQAHKTADARQDLARAADKKFEAWNKKVDQNYLNAQDFEASQEAAVLKLERTPAYEVIVQDLDHQYGKAIAEMHSNVVSSPYRKYPVGTWVCMYQRCRMLVIPTRMWCGGCGAPMAHEYRSYKLKLTPVKYGNAAPSILDSELSQAVKACKKGNNFFNPQWLENCMLGHSRRMRARPLTPQQLREQRPSKPVYILDIRPKVVLKKNQDKGGNEPRAKSPRTTSQAIVLAGPGGPGK